MNLRTFLPDELIHLKEIELDLYTPSTQEDIVSLFAAASALEKISFRFAKGLAGVFAKIKPDQLASLHTIDLTCSDVTANDIHTILTNASLLKKISLFNCHDVAGGFEKLNPGQLKYLEEISFGYANITLKDKEALAKAAPAALIKFTKPSKSEILLDYRDSRNLSLPPSFFDTKPDPNKKLSYSEYFPGIPPNLYRLSVWLPDLNQCSLPPGFNLEEFLPLPPDHYNYTKDSQFICHQGIMPVKNNEGTSIILPSLHAEEKLFDLHLVSENGELVESCLNPD